MPAAQFTFVIDVQELSLCCAVVDAIVLLGDLVHALGSILAMRGADVASPRDGASDADSAHRGDSAGAWRRVSASVRLRCEGACAADARGNTRTSAIARVP